MFGPNAALKKKTKAKRKVRATSAPTNLPAYLRATPDDSLTVHVRGTASVQVDITTGIGKAIIVLNPTNNTLTGVTTLGGLAPVVAGMASNYERFMVSNLTVRPVMTTGYMGGGYIAANFEASNTYHTTLPIGLSDVTRSRHYAMSTPFVQEEYVVQPQTYYADWRECRWDPASVGATDSQAGLITIYANTTAEIATEIGVIEVTATVHFTGLRYN